jgi:hypothetical protein
MSNEKLKRVVISFGDRNVVGAHVERVTPQGHDLPPVPIAVSGKMKELKDVLGEALIEALGNNERLQKQIDDLQEQNVLLNRAGQQLAAKLRAASVAAAAKPK